jgi:hypothetical protein
VLAIADNLGSGSEGGLLSFGAKACEACTVAGFSGRSCFTAYAKEALFSRGRLDLQRKDVFQREV